MYERLSRLAIRRYGMRHDSFRKTLYDVLRRTWCSETARPNMAAGWQSDHPAFGQDDVTAFFLAKYIIGGSIILFKVPEGGSRFAVLVPNGEGSSVEDYCYNWVNGIRSLEVRLTPEELLSGSRLRVHGLPDLDMDRRNTLFFERFDAALSALEREA